MASPETMTLEPDQRIAEVVGREQSRLRSFIRRRVPDRILFGGMGRHGAHRSNWSPEAKRRFRQRVRERLGLDPSVREAESQ